MIPFSLNENWNLISRTIIPYVYQENIIGTSSQSGLSDTVQKSLLLAQGAYERRLDLGCRAVISAPDRHR